MENKDDDDDDDEWKFRASKMYVDFLNWIEDWNLLFFGNELCVIQN
jgi:hypothetical protein